jgi:hypothetical protein
MCVPLRYNDCVVKLEENVVFRMDTDMKMRLGLIATSRHLALSDILREAAREYLARRLQPRPNNGEQRDLMEVGK